MYSKFSQIFAFLFISTLLSSCWLSDDDKVEPQSLVGSWTIAGVDASFDGVNITASQETLDAAYITNKTYTFGEDMSLTSIDSDGDESINGMYSYDQSAQKLVITDVYQGNNYDYHYDVNLLENTLELTSITIDLTKEYSFDDDEVVEIAYDAYSIFGDMEEGDFEDIASNAQSLFLTYKFKKN